LTTTALIPAAGRVPDSVVALSNVSSPAMIPVAGRPLIQWTMSYLLDIGIERFRIAVPQRGLFVEEFVECVFGATTETDFLVPSADRGVGLTVAELCAGVEGAALVVLGDTHFEFSGQADLGDLPCVLVDEVEESYRWCIAEVGDDELVKGFRDKEPDLTGPLLALIGVYYFPDAGLLRRAAEAALAEISGPVQMSDILERVGTETAIRAVRAGTWLDCGNPDRQAASQRVLLEQRAFNELHVDEVFGTITKRSRHVEKFVDEINYLRLLPSDLAVLFPRVVDHSTDADAPHLTLEFYGYPTLAELFVFENVDPGLWRRVFEHLHRLVTEGFLAHPHPVDPSAVRAMYLEKPRQRLAEVEGPPALRTLIDADQPIMVNGKELAPLAHLWPGIEDAVVALEQDALGAVIHGDLCFSNVLYDLRSGVSKLIDPRGSFGHAGLYGDVRYDVAKLWHSVHGWYDFITADLFRLDVDGLEATLEVHRRPYHERIRAEFEDVFFGDAAREGTTRFDRNDIALITGLLFASLPPLHYDHPSRQVAMYLRALQLLDEALGAGAR
jgi:dTDP-glucose pyrophosphorylase